MLTKTAPAARTASQIETVKSLYAAFSRGDIQAIVDRSHENIDWHLNVDQSAPGAKAVPDFKRFHGRAGVKEFFETIGRDIQFNSFEPVAFLEGGNEVVARVFMDLTIKKTGRPLRIESLHHFTFEQGGLLTRFVEFFDTLGAAAAWDVIQAKK